MEECCKNCAYYCKIVNFNYLPEGGCEHTDYDGYGCKMYVPEENIVIHMTNTDENTGLCEMFTERRSDDEQRLD